MPTIRFALRELRSLLCPPSRRATDMPHITQSCPWSNSGIGLCIAITCGGQQRRLVAFFGEGPHLGDYLAFRSAQRLELQFIPSLAPKGTGMDWLEGGGLYRPPQGHSCCDQWV